MDNKAKIVALAGGKAALGIVGTSRASRLPQWVARRPSRSPPGDVRLPGDLNAVWRLTRRAAIHELAA